jgi:hypothetical protein
MASPFAIVDVDGHDAPPGVGRTYDGFDRISRPSILQVKPEQRNAAGGSHRSNIAQRKPSPTSQPTRHLDIGEAQQPRLRAAVDQPAGANNEVGLVAEQGCN